MDDLGFSAIVVTYNDSNHLRECLESLGFCRETIVIDLGSMDRSTAIAAACGARVIRHDWVPMVELIREYGAAQALHEWIIFMDPDMVFPSPLEGRIRSAIRADDTLGMIRLPYRNYFMGRPLYHGVWGDNKYYPAVLHRGRIDFDPSVHSETRTRPGWSSARITPDTDEGFIRHYWVDTWPQFVEKHRRYLALEGESRYGRGMRFSWWRCLLYTTFEPYNHLVRKAGYRDGWAGMLLGVLWTWYTWNAWLSLRRYQQAAGSGGTR